MIRGVEDAAERLAQAADRLARKPVFADGRKGGLVGGRGEAPETGRGIAHDPGSFGGDRVVADANRGHEPAAEKVVLHDRHEGIRRDFVVEIEGVARTHVVVIAPTAGKLDVNFSRLAGLPG